MGPSSEEALQFIVEFIDQATPTLQHVSDALDQVVQKMDAFSGKANSAATSTGSLTTAIATGNIEAAAIEATFGKLVDTAAAVGKTFLDMGMSAARVEELGMAVQVIGQRMGYSAQQLNDFTTGIEKQNITTQSAQQTLLALANAHLDLAKGTQLAAAAQALAIPAQKSSSDTLSILTHVIQTHNEMELQSLNIGADLMQAERNYAKQHNESIQDLDSVARSQIAYNLILEKAAPYASLYGIALENAGKASDSLKDRVTMIGQEFGRAFLPTLDMIIPKVNEMATQFRNWLVDNRTTIDTLGAAIAALARGPFNALVNAVQDMTKWFENVQNQQTIIIPTINFLGNAFKYVADVVSIMIDEFKLIIQVDELVYKAFMGLYGGVVQFGKGIGEDMMGAFKNFVAGSNPVAQAIKGLEGMFQDAANAAINFGKNLLKVVGDQLPQNIRDSLGSIGNDIKNAFQDTQGKGFDFDALIAQFQNLKTKGIDIMADPNAWNSLANNASKTNTKLADELHRMQETMQNMDTENTQYLENVQRRDQSFSDSLESLVQKHRDAANQLKQQISDLTDSFKQSDDDRKSSHDDRVQSIQDKYSQETATIQANLDKQLSSTHKSDDTLIAYFNAQLAAKTKTRDDELKKEDDAFKKEEDKATSSYDKQLKNLQDKLDNEMSIQQKHAADFAKFQDTSNQDDIDRAEAQFNRELDQMKQQHDKKMAELQRQLEDEARLKDRYAGTSTAGKTPSYTPTGGNANYKAPVQSAAPSITIGNVNVNNGLDLNLFMSRLNAGIGLTR